MMMAPPIAKPRSTATAKAKPPVRPMPRPIAPYAPSLLQRKCACDVKPPGGDPCATCASKQDGLQRKLSIGSSNDPLEHEADRIADQIVAMPATPGIGRSLMRIQRSASSSSPSADQVPESVTRVLGGAGRSLDRGMRQDMEQRFGHDFSAVRIHQGADAAQSARDVSARAYTVGSNIVFGGGFAPGTSDGRRLLAHELAHVVQQTSGGREGGEAARLQRQNGTIEVGLAPVDKKGLEESKKLGINLPEVSLETWRQLTSHVGRKLEPLEAEHVASITKSKPPASPLAFKEGPRFVLHDTAGRFNSPYIDELAERARGPLGEEGTAAYVKETGPAVRSYGLFEPRRVASTQFERGTDLMLKSEREAGYRLIWKEADAATRAKALIDALAGLKLSDTEEKYEKDRAVSELNAKAGAMHTTASWVAAEICKAAPLLKACDPMKLLFEKRESRIASTVNVELNMDAGSGTKAALPPYTENQYTNVRDLYLITALTAGSFPEITTHWLIDRGMKEGGHYDPRCFNLHHLYELIAAAMGHNPASEYGIVPVYGVASPANVWWHPTVCGKPPR